METSITAPPSPLKVRGGERPVEFSLLLNVVACQMLRKIELSEVRLQSTYQIPRSKLLSNIYPWDNAKVESLCLSRNTAHSE